MSRPEQRPLHKLPTLESRRPELETCTFCPKLCRAACPVSNAEPRETLIPWGKMTGAYAMAVGDLSLEKESAAPSWACTGCLACSEACDHRNPVASTLIESRSALVDHGLEPAAARRVIDEHHRRYGSGPTVGTGNAHFLGGCLYAERLPAVASNAARVASAAAGRELTPIIGCCGYPLLLAGDREGFVRSVTSLMERLAATSATRLVVADAGCGYALLRSSEELGIPAVREARERGLVIELLVDVVAGALERFTKGGAPLAGATYHDPCSLGRGLGRYEQPRRILAHVLGAPPAEFLHAREGALCSGAGGLLPVTMPATSREITATRVASSEIHESAPIVTACASSLLGFRRAGKVAYDIVEVLARALRSR